MLRDLLLPAWLFEAGIVATVLGSAYLGRCQGFFQATFHGFVVLGAFTGASLFLEPTRQWLAYEGVSGSLQYLTAISVSFRSDSSSVHSSGKSSTELLSLDFQWSSMV